MKFHISGEIMAAPLLAQLPPAEALDVAEIGARVGVYTLTVTDGDKLQGYAVFTTQDAQGWWMIYAARSLVAGLAGMALRAFLGAAQVQGKPLRVHTEKLQAMARMMGADLAQMVRDADGLPQGVFDGV